MLLWCGGMLRLTWWWVVALLRFGRWWCEMCLLYSDQYPYCEILGRRPRYLDLVVELGIS